MARGMERDDLPIAARDEQRVGWIDRKAVPDHLLREYRVGTRSSGQISPLNGDRIFS